MSEQPVQGVTVSFSTMYQEIQTVTHEMRELHSDVRAVLQTTGQHEKRIQDHESRLRSIERKIWIATGLAGSVSAVATALITTTVKIATGV